MLDKRYSMPKHKKQFGLRFYTINSADSKVHWQVDTRFYDTIESMLQSKKNYESRNNHLYTWYRAIPFHMYYENVDLQDIYHRNLPFDDKYLNPLELRIQKGFTYEDRYQLAKDLHEYLDLEWLHKFMSLNSKDPIEFYMHVYYSIYRSFQRKMLGIPIDLVKNETVKQYECYKIAVYKYLEKLHENTNYKISL